MFAGRRLWEVLMSLRAVRPLICLCLLSILWSSHAKADTLTVGTFSFDLLQTGASGPVFGFDLFNGTQPGGGSQVATFVNFVSLTLTLTLMGGGTMTVPLTPTDAFGDFSTGALFSSGQILSATLTGTFAPTTVTLADGTVVIIGATLSAVLNNLTGGPLQGGELVTINATVLQTVSEPSTLVLLGLSLLFLTFRARSGLRRRTNQLRTSDLVLGGAAR